MTKEEYRSKTSIQSVEEAKAYLKQTKTLFISVFVATVFVNFIAGAFDQWIQLVLWVSYIAFYIYFVVYCSKIKKLTKEVSKADVVWSVIFAPLSWIWFYPLLTNPLKIIAGELEPPERLQTLEERQAIHKGANKRFWKTILIVFFAVGALILVMSLSQNLRET